MGRIEITDQANQKQDLAALERDTSNLNGAVSKTPDLQQVLSSQSDLINAAQAAAEAVAKQIGNYADGKEKAAREAAGKASDPGVKAQYELEANAWAEGGANRVGLHAAGGALTGGLTGGGLGAVGGAAGAGLSAKLAPELNEIAKSIKDAGPTGNKNVDELLGNLTANVLAGGVGGVVGGGAGALGGAGVDLYNRQLHPDERQWVQDRAKDFVAFYKQKTGQDITVDQAKNMLLVNGYRLVDAAASKGPGGDPTAVAYINQNGGGLFAKDQHYNNPFMFGNKDGSPTSEQAALSSNSGKPGGPGLRAPDYSSANGSGMSVAYGTSVNLHDGQIYVGGGKANPFSPSGNIMFGYLLSPGDEPTIETNHFLNGAAVPIGGCVFGVCIGVNHSIGGQTSIEFGLGTPGVSVGVTVSRPVGGYHWRN